eukprot:6185458-Pleurochrysis_carterae.AAC.1
MVQSGGGLGANHGGCGDESVKDAQQAKYRRLANTLEGSPERMKNIELRRRVHDETCAGMGNKS